MDPILAGPNPGCYTAICPTLLEQRPLLCSRYLVADWCLIGAGIPHMRHLGIPEQRHGQLHQPKRQAVEGT